MDAHFQGLDARWRPVAEGLRALVREAAPDLEERLKWGQPTYAGQGNVCYVAVGRDHVKLGFFHGAHLPDPEGLLEGTGKAMRHVKVRSLSERERAALRDLVRHAAVQDRG